MTVLAARAVGGVSAVRCAESYNAGCIDCAAAIHKGEETPMSDPTPREVAGAKVRRTADDRSPELHFVETADGRWCLNAHDGEWLDSGSPFPFEPAARAALAAAQERASVHPRPEGADCECVRFLILADHGVCRGRPE